MTESIKWLKWRVPATTTTTTTTTPEKTAATPHHKPPHRHDQQQAISPQVELSLDPHLKPVAETAVDIKKYQDENNNESFERMLQPHIGMNPFLNGNTYLNDIVVQNTMLRGEGGRRL